MPRPRASVIRDEVATGDPDLAHHTIAEQYSAHRPRFAGSALGFRFRLAVTQAGELGVDEIVHSMDARSWTEPYVGFLAVHVRRGWYHWQVGRDELALPPGAVGRFHNSPMTLQSRSSGPAWPTTWRRPRWPCSPTPP
ncbi:hypothetical protein ACGFI4_06790 [Micromonospora carbonacea]|uniref:hypothetical protein n=1 Tax=Micromonospora carbonacea TaxID=47853 RepID=UPI003714EBF2